jgi:hypothetical protein
MSMLFAPAMTLIDVRFGIVETDPWCVNGKYVLLGVGASDFII